MNAWARGELKLCADGSPRSNTSFATSFISHEASEFNVYPLAQIARPILSSEPTLSLNVRSNPRKLLKSHLISACVEERSSRY